MSVRVAGPARVLVENLEERWLLSGVGDAVAWDLKTPVSVEASREPYDFGPMTVPFVTVGELLST